MSHSAQDSLLRHAVEEGATSTVPAILDRLEAAEQSVREALRDDDLVAVAPEVSVVMPCLNEADTLAICITKAQCAMHEAGIAGEVIVADNGSTDGSQQIAAQLGARVVPVAAKGYGNALMGGIQAARGKFVIMGDADDSYDFLEIPKFVAKLRSGHDLVQGCRLPSGGGTVKPGAMPFSHRWLGNPMFSWLVQKMFRAPIHDVYCGLRGFTKELYGQLDLRCTGMEFATEMIIKSSLFEVDIAEVPTTLHPDGRKAHAPHLRTFRDGWRTLRFFLMYSPRWCFFVPGLLFMLLGMLGYGLALPGVTVLGARLDAHSLLVASLALLLGSQLVQLAAFAKTFADFRKTDPRKQTHAVVSADGHAGAGAFAGTGDARGWGGAAVGGRCPVAGRELRAPRLRCHHAVGDSRGHARGAGMSGDVCEFLSECLADVPQVTSCPTSRPPRSSPP